MIWFFIGAAIVTVVDIIVLLIKQRFGFSGTVKNIIVSVVCALLILAIWVYNPKPKYTGNPESDCYIFKERLVEFDYDVEAAAEEMFGIYIEKGFGKQSGQKTQETLTEFSNRCI